MNKILYIHNANFNSINANKLQVMNMCNAFVENSCEISLVSFGDLDFVKDNYLFNYNIKLKLLNSKSNYYFRTIKLVFNTLSNKKYDLIFTRDLVYTFLIKLLKPNVNIIYELHEIKKNILWKFIFDLVFRKINNLVVISNGLKNELVSLGFNSKKITVLHDGVDFKKFDVDLSRSEARKVLNLNVDEKIVLYIGSFQNWKGYKTFLDSSENNLNPKVKFYCIGGGENQITYLENKYPEVIFREFVNTNLVPVWLKAANVLVIPNSGKFEISRYYTSPLKLFEYMASKTPIVASDLPSIRDVVSEDDVLFFEADNPNDLFKKIQSILKVDEFEKIEVPNSFKKVKKYTWENRAKEILNLI